MVNIPVNKFIISEIHEWTETKKYVLKCKNRLMDNILQS